MVRVTIDAHFYHSNGCKSRFQKQQTVVKGLVINLLLDGIADEFADPMLRMPVTTKLSRDSNGFLSILSYRKRSVTVASP